MTIDRMLLRHLYGLCVLGLATGVGSAAVSQAPQPASLQTHSSRTTLPWYVKTGAIHRVSLKKNSTCHRFEHLSLDAAEAASQLKEWRDAGIDAIEVFAPEEGGNSHNGLDAKDRYTLNPGIGSMSDFRRLVRKAHRAEVDARAIPGSWYRNLESRESSTASDGASSVELSGYGHRIFRVDQ